MIDALSKRYGKMPSEIMQHATTFDLAVMDAAVSYQRYAEEKARLGYEPIEEPTIEEMQAMLEAVRKNNNG